MVVLVGGAVSYERGTPVRGRAKCHFTPRVLLVFPLGVGNFWRDCPRMIDFDLTGSPQDKPSRLKDGPASEPHASVVLFLWLQVVLVL